MHSSARISQAQSIPITNTANDSVMRWLDVIVVIAPILGARDLRTELSTHIRLVNLSEFLALNLTFPCQRLSTTTTPHSLDAQHPSSQSWLSARTSVFQRARRVLRRRPTPSRRRTGTTSRRQELSPSESKRLPAARPPRLRRLNAYSCVLAASERPSSTAPPVSRTRTMR